MNNKCSLELAKRLKELGVKQESEFYWCKGDGFDDRTFKEYTLLDEIAFGKWWGGRTDRQSFYSAFTVGELGEGLPVGINTIKRNVSDSKIDYQVSGVVCKYNKKKDCMDWFTALTQYADTEANARAKMLIHLLEKKLIKVEAING